MHVFTQQQYYVPCSMRHTDPVTHLNHCLLLSWQAHSTFRHWDDGKPQQAAMSYSNKKVLTCWLLSALFQSRLNIFFYFIILFCGFCIPQISKFLQVLDFFLGTFFYSVKMTINIFLPQWSVETKKYIHYWFYLTHFTFVVKAHNFSLYLSVSICFWVRELA